MLNPFLTSILVAVVYADDRACEGENLAEGYENRGVDFPRRG